MIRVKRSEIVRIAQQIKDGEYKQVYLNVNEDGTIEGSWFFGRSDFVLHPGFIVLLELGEQPLDAIIYAITMILRNQEGYGVAAG